MRPRLTRVFGSSKAPATLGSQMRNSHRARKRGWITTSTSAAELSVSANANNQSRTLTFRWRNDSDPDPHAADWVEPASGPLLEHEPTPPAKD